MYESEGGTKLQQTNKLKRTKIFIKWTELVGGASVRRGPRAERRQRGRKHQHFGLHEGQVGQP